MSNTQLMRVDEAVCELETATQAIAALKSLVNLESPPEGLNKLLTVDRTHMAALLSVLSSRLSLDVENVKAKLSHAIDGQRQERAPAPFTPPHLVAAHQTFDSLRQ